MGISMLFAFLGLMVMGVPLFISLLSTSLLGIIMLGDFSLLRVMSQQFFGGMDVFFPYGHPVLHPCGDTHEQVGTNGQAS